MKKFLHFFILFFLFTFPLSSLCKFLDSLVPDESLISLRGNLGRTVGNNTSYTTFETFSIPFHYDSIWPILDIRAHRFYDKENKYAGNLGIGCRFAPKSTDTIFGINAYYDFRNAHQTCFRQLGLGFEILGDCWNMRLNGYLPIGKNNVLDSSCLFDDFYGSYYMLKKNYVSSLKGIDFELETYVTSICGLDMYLGMGAYYYKGDRCREDVYGTEYRITNWYCDYFSFSVSATHDCVFKTRVQAEISLSFPFQCSKCGNDKVLTPIRRREIIVLEKHNRWRANF